MASGAVRNHDIEIMKKAFAIAGYDEEVIKKKFRSLYTAFQYGAPPHGGIAFGFDRLCSILCDADSIRDFIAFPKTNSARDVMLNIPSPISEAQLKELGLKVEE